MEVDGAVELRDADMADDGADEWAGAYWDEAASLGDESDFEAANFGNDLESADFEPGHLGDTGANSDDDGWVEGPWPPPQGTEYVAPVTRVPTPPSSSPPPPSSPPTLADDDSLYSDEASIVTPPPALARIPLTRSRASASGSRLAALPMTSRRK